MTATLPRVPRRATGSTEAKPWSDGRTETWFIRVRQGGQRYRVKLGTNHEGWSIERAQVELERVLGQVERGTWQPPQRHRILVAPKDETFQITASRWWHRRRGELAERTRLDYRWRLDHLLRLVAPVRVSEIDTRRVDDVRVALLAKGLSARSVNMILDLLAQVLDDAVDAKIIDANPARGKRRRVKLPKQRRTFLEPDMARDLLDEAGAWEAALPLHQRYGRRALLALLTLGGLRITEALTATVGALDLHGGRLRVGDAKTEAGLRDVELSWFLLGELRGQVARLARPGDGGSHVLGRDRGHGGAGRTTPAGLPIFPSTTGKPLNPSNIRNRLLATTVERVNARREAEARMTLPHVTPHSLRRTFASLALAAGRDPRWVMAQLGHADARLTLNVYAQVVQRQRVDEALIHELMDFPGEEPASADRTPTRTSAR
jgi:integrase